MADTLAYRANIDVGVAHQSVEAGDLFFLPERSADDDRISLLVAAQAIERAPEHDGGQAPVRRRRK